jgi:polar amino acid transport system substrate-binding protein
MAQYRRIWNGYPYQYFIRKDRKKFSANLLDNAQVIIVQKVSGIKDQADLAGKTIGLQGGSSAMNAVQADKATFDSFGDLVEFASNDEALLDLAAGRLDAVVVDQIVGRYYIAKKADVYELADEDFGAEEFALDSRKDDVACLTKCSYSDEMKADGSREISQKCFGADM